MISEGAANLGYITTYLFHVKSTLFTWEVNLILEDASSRPPRLYGSVLGKGRETE